MWLLIVVGAGRPLMKSKFGGGRGGGSFGTLFYCTVGCKSFGRYVLLGFKQQQQDLIYNHLCLRK